MITSRAAILPREMRDEARLVLDLIDGHETREIIESPWLSRALALSFVVIGEASAQMPATVRAAHAQIAWDQSKALRNRIAHGYRTVVPEALIDTARRHLPELITQIDRILAEGDESQ